MADHVEWLIKTYGIVEAERVAKMYGVGATEQGYTVFWQRDVEGRVRAGKIMVYDEWSDKRLKIEKVLLKSFEQHLYFVFRYLTLL